MEEITEWSWFSPVGTTVEREFTAFCAGDDQINPVEHCVRNYDPEVVTVRRVRSTVRVVLAVERLLKTAHLDAAQVKLI